MTLSSERPSVTLCIAALIVGEGVEKLYRRVPGTELPKFTSSDDFVVGSISFSHNLQRLWSYELTALYKSIIIIIIIIKPELPIFPRLK